MKGILAKHIRKVSNYSLCQLSKQIPRKPYIKLNKTCHSLYLSWAIICKRTGLRPIHLSQLNASTSKEKFYEKSQQCNKNLTMCTPDFQGFPPFLPAWGWWKIFCSPPCKSLYLLIPLTITCCNIKRTFITTRKCSIFWKDYD